MLTFPMTNFLPMKNSRAVAGFSLVEVTLALGIVSFSLLTMVGVMPVGLSTLKQATEQTTESQIVQKIGCEAYLTSFSKLGTSFSGRTFYYDERGKLLAASPASAPAGTRYWAKASVVDSVFPGSANAGSQGAMANSLVLMRIDILSGPSEELARSTNSYSIQIANAGN